MKQLIRTIIFILVLTSTGTFATESMPITLEDGENITSKDLIGKMIGKLKHFFILPSSNRS